jgi:hypothetical protein
MRLTDLLEGVKAEELRHLASKTELPAFKETLRYLSDMKGTCGWINQYCDYKQCRTHL